MQYISKHSSAARRSLQPRTLLQPVAEYSAPRYASAVAGLPSLGGGDFELPVTYRISRPVAAAPANTVAPRRPAETSSTGGTLLGLSLGWTAGLTLGAMICSAILG
jgi:hypothetical protein